MPSINENISVSVVIPCFNSRKTIFRAIRSVLNQSVKVKEIILVDDFSSDGSQEYIANLIQKLNDKRIRLICLKENSGPGCARNIGWDNSTGDWIAFLDADDSWNKSKIEIQYNWANSKSNVDLCSHASIIYKARQFDSKKDFSFRKISYYRMLFSNQIETRTVMLRRKIPIRFKDRNFTEDYLLWLEIIYLGYSAYKLKTYLSYTYRDEFSSGGYSGNLWQHEKKELNAFIYLYKTNKLSFGYFIFFFVLSFLKFLIRFCKRNLK